jgi:molecular chaperone GrpE (heat shock protein)
MNEVRLSTEKYDALQHSIQTKAAKIDALEAEIGKLKSDHEAEIEKLTKEGKVKVVEKMPSPFSTFLMLTRREYPRPRYMGFDEVKAEVEEHFKQGLFEEELKKFEQNKLADLMKQVSEKETAIDDLKAEVERLKNRSLWERIRNK